MRKIAAIVFALLSSLSAFSQKYTVEQDSGTFKPTRIVFNSKDGKPVDLHLLQSQSQTVGVSLGLNGEKWINIGSFTTSVTTSYLMTIPGSLLLDEGYLNLYVGSSRQFATFSIKPEGGTQFWEVHRYHPARYYSGLAFLCAGIASFVIGAQVWRANGSPSAFTTAIISAGNAVAAGGVAMVYTARPWVRLTETCK